MLKSFNLVLCVELVKGLKMNISIKKHQTACITGHRPKSLPWGYDEEKQNCLLFKAKAKSMLEDAINYGITTFLTGMAEGFDMIATELLLELKQIYNQIKIVAVIPCLNQEIKWKPHQQLRYHTIKAQCDDIIVLSPYYTANCMNIRNKFMVKHSCLCVACWNGLPSGTGNTIRFAKENGNKIKIINPKDYI